MNLPVIKSIAMKRAAMKRAANAVCVVTVGSRVGSRVGCRCAMRSMCVLSGFGLYVEVTKESDLDRKILVAKTWPNATPNGSFGPVPTVVTRRVAFKPTSG